MTSYVIRRLIQAPLIFLVLVSISFFMMRFAPGGPFSAEKKLDPVVEKALNAKYHLDKPLYRQYLMYLGDLVRGDLGPSFKHRARSVNEIISKTLPHSIVLGIMALSLSVLIGVLCGIFSAVRHHTLTDDGIMLFALLGLSIPTFVIGPMLQIAFAIHLPWFPLAGYDGLGSPSYLVLPAITLALPFAARFARLTRSGMLDVLHQDYVRTARAKGLSESRVIFVHALRGGILPVVSFLGPATAMITTGSLVVEKIFQIPGLGREFVESALNRDYTLVLGTVVVYGGFIILFNLLSDIAIGLLDPRVRF